MSMKNLQKYRTKRHDLNEICTSADPTTPISKRGGIATIEF